MVSIKAEGPTAVDSLGASGDFALGRAKSLNATPGIIAQTEAARDRVEVWTTLVAWQVDLQQRVDCARIVHELVDSELDFEHLIEEQAQLSRAIRAHARRATA